MPIYLQYSWPIILPTIPLDLHIEYSWSFAVKFIEPIRRIINQYNMNSNARIATKVYMDNFKTLLIAAPLGKSLKSCRLISYLQSLYHNPNRPAFCDHTQNGACPYFPICRQFGQNLLHSSLCT